MQAQRVNRFTPYTDNNLAAWGGAPRELSGVVGSLEEVFSLDDEPLRAAQVQAALPADPTAMPVAQNVRWLLEPSSEEERLLQVHAAVEVEYAEQQEAPLEPAALCATLARLGYSARLHSSAEQDKSLRRLLCGLRHEYVTVCMPDASDAGLHCVVVDAAFRDSFSVAHPTPRYQTILDAVPSVVVTSKVSLRRAVALLSREMALSFSDQGLSTPPWRTAAAMLARWDLQAASPGLGAGGGEASTNAAPQKFSGQLSAAFKAKLKLNTNE